MEELIKKLQNENKDILNKHPNLVYEFDWSSAAYKLEYNTDMINELKKLIKQNTK